MKQGRSKGLIALIVVLAFILTSQVALAGPTIHVLGDAVGSGKAEMKTAFDKWLSVTGKAYPVVDGTTFRTLEGAVSVMLRDGVRMEMGKQTTLIVNGAQGNYTVAVNSGTLGFTVPVGTAFSVITPTATVLVQQGEGAVGKAGLTPGETVRGVVVCDAKGTKVMSLNMWATGWKPYDAKKLETYGFGTYPDVITNVMIERLASWTGPTQGKIVRPSDGKAPESVAFVQCAGSRDQNHLPFCSGICCLASMKEATYVREQYPDAAIYIFFIDIRATDRLEDFYTKVKKDEKIQFFKGKVAKITQGKGKLILRVEDTTKEALNEIAVDMVVLATGVQPNTSENPLPTQVPYDDYGFIASQHAKPGIYAAGCTRTPTGVSESVQDGTAAALKGIQSITRR